MNTPLQAVAPAWRDCACAAFQGLMVAVAILAPLYPSAVESGSLYPVAGALADRRPGLSTPFASYPRVAKFQDTRPSAETRALADWVAWRGDNRGRPFAIVDKKAAQLYVFDGESQLQASSPVLLGSAIGDESAPGIGDRPIEQVKSHERTTPAGRFVTERGRNARGEDVVWVDYDAGVSMHRVISSNADERRLERLASPTAGDNRISYGCINVPVAFYELYIRPAFARHSGVVYVTPDKAPLRQFFDLS